MLRILCGLIFFTLSAHAHPFDIEVREPEYKDNTLYTKSGAVLQSEHIRIQAQCAEITHANGESILTAKQHIAFLYNDRLILAESLQYNLNTKEGTAHSARTAVGMWYIGSDTIALHANGSVTLRDAYLTPEDCLSKVFALRSQNITLSKSGMLYSDGTRFEIAGIPALYIPAFQTNLKKKGDSPVSYNLSWISGQGPRLTMRYRIYGSDHSAAYLRGDLTPRRGFAGAFETSHSTPQRSLSTKSYLAHDTFYRAVDPNKKKTRYRLQGTLRAHSRDATIRAQVQYDKISDRDMINDFPTDDFALESAEKTALSLRYYAPRATYGVTATPRINTFQGFTQQLPSLFIRSFPVRIGATPSYAVSDLHVEYLNHTPSRFVDTALPDFAAGRVANNTKVFASFTPSIFSFSPYIGYSAIGYTNAQDGNGKLLLTGRYGALLDSKWRKRYSACTHTITPYARFQGVSKPTTRPANHFIFGLHDGIDTLNLLTFGVTNNLTWRFSTQCLPTLSFDLFGLSFLGTTPFTHTIPKAGADITCNFPRVHLMQNFLWNFEQNLLDYSRSRILWTINQHAALSFEVQHRSAYYWRKNDYDNFILDANRSAEQLENTPLSDKRTLALSKLQFRLHPLCHLQFSAHHGWGRQNQPSYNECKIDLTSQLTTHWKARFSFTKTTDASIAVAGFELVPLPIKKTKR